MHVLYLRLTVNIFFPLQWFDSREENGVTLRNTKQIHNRPYHTQSFLGIALFKDNKF